MRRIHGSRTEYRLWKLANSSTSQIQNSSVQGSGADSYTVRAIELGDLEAIARARPGYSTAARAYLAAGHSGHLALTPSGQVAALAWHFQNSGAAKELVKGYFEVLPGETYLHAAWVHPEHRRQGLHWLLLKARIASALEQVEHTTFVANIELGNYSSERTYSKVGFTTNEKLIVVRHGRKTVKNKRRPIAPDKESAIRVLLLDGDAAHTVPIARELKESLNASIYTVSRGYNSLASRSRHVTDTVVIGRPTDPEYEDLLLQAALSIQPDVIVPVGYNSTEVCVRLREMGQLQVPTIAPPSTCFRIGEDKIATAKVAESVGIHTPRDFTDLIHSHSLNEVTRFPIIAKARLERGGSTIRILNNSDELRKFSAAVEPGDYLFQEFITGDSITFAHCGYFQNGEPLIEFQHAELRSIPRVGGSGTRLKSINNAELRDAARNLLRASRWTGVAQVEFKRSHEGTLVLMEINPKLWASYALAPRSGAQIVSVAVQETLGLPSERLRRQPHREVSMVFPLREAKYILNNKAYRDIPSALLAMIWPPARTDIQLSDLRGYLQSI